MDERIYHFLRNPERLVDITDEFLTTLPVGKHYMDVWYDKTDSYFACRRTPTGKTQMVVLYTMPEHKAKTVVIGDNSRYDVLNKHQPDMKVAEARVLAKGLHDKAVGYIEEAKKVVLGTIQARKAVSIEDMLKERPIEVAPNYDALMSILMDAFDQAANGKGEERHGNGLHFEDQDMMQIMDQVGTDFAFGQAMKKIKESRGMTRVKARRELLGAIVYLAGSILWRDRQ